MRHFRSIQIILAVAALALFLPQSAHSLNLSIQPLQYANAMEFYYQTPKPELVQPMLRAFAKAGWLGHAEKRLSVAAFLAELAKGKKLNLPELARAIAPCGRDAKLTAAWALHLAGMDGIALELLPGERDRQFVAQIKNSPIQLLQWNLTAEPSVLGMYWSAFMAAGDITYIDAIIECALDLRNYQGARRAAASLYEYAPRHPAIAARIKKRLRTATVNERERLETMLHK